MKRLQNLLDSYSIAIKPLLVIAWVLWGLQLSDPVKETFKQIRTELREARSGKIDWKAEVKAGAELQKLVDELIAKAKKEGSSYGPKRYFEDLLILKERCIGCSNIFPSIEYSSSAQLQQFVIGNVKKGFYSQKDIANESGIFKQKLEELTVGSDREEFYGKVESITMREFLLWLITFYFRTLPLVALYYLTRMAQRKGILETILAGKSNFVAAILLFPFFFGKYPFNIIREIRVEAELRRMKQFFRVLSAKEAKAVKRIANSPYYEQWLASYRRQNQRKFKRGLILALGGTIVFHILLFPSMGKASEKTNGSAVIACQGEQSHEQNVSSYSQDSCQTQVQGIVPEADFVDSPVITSLIVLLEEIVLSRRLDPPDRIPLSLLFGYSAQVATQTALKGWNHERESDHSVGCPVCLRFSFRRQSG